MLAYGRLLLLLAALVVAAPAWPDAGDDPEPNRKLLEKWRADPERLARLKRDLRAFRALPPDRQEKIRRLDEDLSEEDSTTQARLLRVLDRYVSWLERLPEDERNRIEAEPDPKQRLRLIRQLRDREWVHRLPALEQRRVLNTPAEKLDALVAQLRKEERDKRQQWLLALRPREQGLTVRKQQPIRLSDFPPEVQGFVTNNLLPLLSPEEGKRLKEVENLWPHYVRTLVELAQQHPIVLPGPTTGPTSFRDIPDLQKKLMKDLVAKEKRQITAAQGKWPDFAIAVTEVARTKQVPLPKFGPTRPEDFPAMQHDFILNTLIPRLDAEEKKQLDKEEGAWPEYPKKVMELARKKELQVPGMTLPGAREYWESLRSALPDVPDATLRSFALTELTPQELAELRLALDDPQSRERLKQEYFKRKPKELDKLLFNDHRKFIGKKARE